jgi:mannonate dehydratase
MKHWLINPNHASLPRHLAEHELMARVWEGIDPMQVWDSHAHLAGVGDSCGGRCGAWFNPKMNSILHPMLWLHKQFIMNAGGVRDPNEGIDQQYIDRMRELLAAMPAGVKIMLLAFDYAHGEDGKESLEDSTFFVANDYAADVCRRYPDSFEWFASVHPYRQDAADEVHRAAAAGARGMKWLPSSQLIDPASPLCKPFCDAMAETGLPMVAHAGAEKAVPGGRQEDGNPLKLRYALDAGVKIIVAHCASDGRDTDLDKGANGPVVKSYELFARMMDETRYEGLLFADISATTLLTRGWALRAVLERPDWHHRLLNGSDYPLPGVMPMNSPHALALSRVLDTDVLPFLHELKLFNPLLYDFAVKRLARSNGHTFPASVFETRRFFEETPA